MGCTVIVSLLSLFRLTSLGKGPFKPSTIVIADAQSSLMGGVTVGLIEGEVVGAVGLIEGELVIAVGEPVQEWAWFV